MLPRFSDLDGSIVLALISATVLLQPTEWDRLLNYTQKLFVVVNKKHTKKKRAAHNHTITTLNLWKKPWFSLATFHFLRAMPKTIRFVLLDFFCSSSLSSSSSLLAMCFTLSLVLCVSVCYFLLIFFAFQITGNRTREQCDLLNKINSPHGNVHNESNIMWIVLQSWMYKHLRSRTRIQFRTKNSKQISNNIVSARNFNRSKWNGMLYNYCL